MLLLLGPILKSVEEASHQSCDWKWAFFLEWVPSSTLICSSMPTVAEPVLPGVLMGAARAELLLRGEGDKSWG